MNEFYELFDRRIIEEKKATFNWDKVKPLPHFMVSMFQSTPIIFTGYMHEIGIHFWSV